MGDNITIVKIEKEETDYQLSEHWQSKKQFTEQRFVQYSTLYNIPSEIHASQKFWLLYPMGKSLFWGFDCYTLSERDGTEL